MRRSSNLGSLSLLNVFYLKLLPDEACKGNKPLSTFKLSSIAHVNDTISERFGIGCEPDHIENHLKMVKATRRQFQLYNARVDSIGMTN